MKTILELLQTIKDATADLEEEVKQMNKPFAGYIEPEQTEHNDDENYWNELRDEQMPV